MGKITMNPMQNKQVTKTFEEGFNEFIRYCKIKNLADHTIVYYERCFHQFINVYPADKPVQGITTDTIEDFILYLRENTDCNSISINTPIPLSIRVILKYLMELGYIKPFKISLIKAEKRIKKVYTDTELQILLEKPNPKKCRFTTFRDWAMVNYLLATANRISTVANIQIGDLDFKDGFITGVCQASCRINLI